MKIFETHAHYDDSDFDEDREELITSMLSDDGALDCLINVGASLKGCEDSLLLASKYDKVYAAIGVHPEEVEGLTMGHTLLDSFLCCLNAKYKPRIIDTIATI